MQQLGQVRKSGVPFVFVTYKDLSVVTFRADDITNKGASSLDNLKADPVPPRAKTNSAALHKQAHGGAESQVKAKRGPLCSV